MSSSISKGDATQSIIALRTARKVWRKRHEAGFIGGPSTNEDGSKNLHEWNFSFPGKKNSLYGGKRFKIRMKFSNAYPVAPPKVFFTETMFHPNIFSDGQVCLSILSYGGWNRDKPITMNAILVALQVFLLEPNPDDAVNVLASGLFKEKKIEYEAKVKAVIASMEDHSY